MRMTGKEDLFTYEEVSRLAKRLEEETIETRCELTKYKKAFEILREKGIFEFKDYTNMIFLKPEDYIWNGDIIEEMFINVNEEEYELLEELMEIESR